MPPIYPILTLEVLRDTLAHLVGVEWLWLERWSVVESGMRSYLAGLTQEALGQPLTCVGTRGNTWTYPLWRMHMHLLNHQTYHRGQVTTLLRQLGVPPARVDFLVAHDAGLSAREQS